MKTHPLCMRNKFTSYDVNCEDFREYYKKVIYDVGKPFSFCYTETNGLDPADHRGG